LSEDFLSLRGDLRLAKANIAVAHARNRAAQVVAFGYGDEWGERARQNDFARFEWNATATQSIA
jgi:hypothetical protein